jgi:hypothetical protein
MITGNWIEVALFWATLALMAAVAGWLAWMRRQDRRPQRDDTPGAPEGFDASMARWGYLHDRRRGEGGE